MDEGEALALFNGNDLPALGVLAENVKRQKTGDRGYYAVNAAITYSNTCEALCPICSFARAEGAEGAYLLSPDDVCERAKKYAAAGAEEVHIIGGMYSKLPLEYYLDVVRAAKSADRKLNVVAYTVSECVLMSKVSQKPLGDVYELLKDAGLGALPGGGAEIFDEPTRSRIAPKKLSAAEWLDAMRQAHRHGIRTNATMLYGHIETPRDIVRHLVALRTLQDETGGFKAFVPLPFRQGHSKIPGKNSGVLDLKVCALSRVVLDNFDHIRVPVPHFGARMAQVMLNFGADDIGGTHWHEEVATSAGASDFSRTEAFMRGIITDAGLVPVKTNSNYA